MLTPVKRKLIFSPPHGREENAISTPAVASSTATLTYSGQYSDFMARAFGPMGIEPVGSSTPGIGVMKNLSLSSGSLSDEHSREIILDLQGLSTPASHREATPRTQANALTGYNEFEQQVLAEPIKPSSMPSTTSLLLIPGAVGYYTHPCQQNMQTGGITTQERLPVNVTQANYEIMFAQQSNSAENGMLKQSEQTSNVSAQNQHRYGDTVDTELPKMLQNITLKSTVSPNTEKKINTCINLQTNPTGITTRLPIIQDQQISSTGQNIATSSRDYSSLILKQEHLQQQLLHLQSTVSQQQEQLQLKNEEAKYMHEQLHTIKQQHEQLQIQKQRQEAQLLAQQELIQNQQEQIEFHKQEQEKQRFMQQQQFEQKLLQLQQQQQLWQQEIQSKLMAQTLPYANITLASTPYNMASTLTGQEQPIQQSYTYQTRKHQVRDNTQRNIIRNSCQTFTDRQVHQPLNTLQPSYNIAPTLQNSATQEMQSKAIYTTANSMEMQAPQSLICAPENPAAQIFTSQVGNPPNSLQQTLYPNAHITTTGTQQQAYNLPLSAAPCITPAKNTNNSKTNQGSVQQPQQFTKRKEIQPDNFDGSGKIEWSDYLVHFELCAAWNQWSDSQKAQMISIHLRGEAQKLLSGLTISQLNDYSTLKAILSDRYDPKEKEVTYRCQFRFRRRENGESASDYGYNLSKLAQKAYPNLTLRQLEVHVKTSLLMALATMSCRNMFSLGTQRLYTKQ